MKRLKYGVAILMCCSTLINSIGVKYIINKPVFIATMKNEINFHYKDTNECYKTLMKNAKKYKEEKDREEELKKITLLNTKDEPRLSRGGMQYEKIEFVLTFYCTTKDENGGYTTTKYGEPLVGNHNFCASNVYSRNTRIYLEELGKELIVADTGGKDFDSPYRLDVLIQRNKGESTRDYKRRVHNMGKVKTVGYIIK